MISNEGFERRLPSRGERAFERLFAEERSERCRHLVAERAVARLDRLVRSGADGLRGAEKLCGTRRIALSDRRRERDERRADQVPEPECLRERDALAGGLDGFGRAAASSRPSRSAIAALSSKCLRASSASPAFRDAFPRTVSAVSVRESSRAS